MTDGDEDTATATSVPINVSSVVTGTGSIYSGNWGQNAYNFQLNSNTSLQGDGWYLLSLTDSNGMVLQEWQELVTAVIGSTGYFHLGPPDMYPPNAAALEDGLDAAIASPPAGAAACTWQIPP